MLEKQMIAQQQAIERVNNIQTEIKGRIKSKNLEKEFEINAKKQKMRENEARSFNFTIYFLSIC